MRTLDGLPIVFPTLGWQAANWIEAYCCHGPGDVSGQRIGLLPDEIVQFLCWAYRLDPDSGRRLVTDADLLGPKGYAKSEIAGWVSVFEAFGPCRFDGWGAAPLDDFGNRTPIGKPVRSPFIRCLATEETQAGNTYDVIYTCLTEGPAADEFASDPGLTRTFIKEPGGGEIVPSTSGDVSKDGGKESFAVGDEPHLYVLPGIKRMYRTVERNLPKRKIAQPWFLRTSTAWEPGGNSIAEENWQEFESVDCDVERAIRELGLLVDYRVADQVEITPNPSPKVRAREDAALLAALTDVYGYATEFVDLERIIRKHFRRPGADIADARRYYLNQVVKATGKWLEPDRVEALTVDDRLQPGDQIALGFDGSKTMDATGLVAVRLIDGLIVPLHVQERPRNLPKWKAWEVDSVKVNAAVSAAFSTYRVYRLYADPHWWRPEVDAWHGEHGDKVVKFDTSKPTRVVVAVDRFEKDVNSGAVKFVRDEALRRHLLNTYAIKTKVVLEALAPDDPARYGKTLSKESKESRDLIDLTMGAVLGNHARGDAIAAGALHEKTRSKVPWSA
jgi:hypothetical protein